MPHAYPVAVAAARTVITVFEVPPDADEDFLASQEWRGVLHRALRADVDFRFVEIGGGDSPAEPQRFDSHSGVYEVASEHGRPDVDGGVVRIEPFVVPGEADDERFCAAWERLRSALAQQRGYLGSRLHRSTGPARFRFVDVARWSSPLMFARALQLADVRQAVEAMPYASHPALYVSLSTPRPAG
jgi:hypothetical protein